MGIINKHRITPKQKQNRFCAFRKKTGRYSNNTSVEFINVNKTFIKKNKTTTNVLKHLSFRIDKGKTTAILGSSGAGKTTIARIINSLEEYNSGKVIVSGILLTKKTQKEIRKKTAFVFQNFNLFPNMSVLNNIIYTPIHVLHKDKDIITSKANQMLRRFNLSHKIDCLPHELSGGQKQRVAIIRALILEPEILIMDEPTASLDPELTHDVINIIRLINKTGITVVVITHDIVVAKKATDNVIMIHGGRCIDAMPTKKFFDKTSKKHFYSQKFLQNCE